MLKVSDTEEIKIPEMSVPMPMLGICLKNDLQRQRAAASHCTAALRLKLSASHQVALTIKKRTRRPPAAAFGDDTQRKIDEVFVKTWYCFYEG